MARRDKTFLIWVPFEGTEQSWTYGEFVARAQRVAAGLWRRGVRPGDRGPHPSRELPRRLTGLVRLRAFSAPSP